MPSRLRPARSRPARRPSERRTRAVGVVAALVTLVSLSSCGGSGKPDGITDAATDVVTATVPDWFPASFPPPKGGVIVSVVADPSTGNDQITFGRSVTWRVDKPYNEVLKDLDAVLRSLGWTPTERLATEGEADSQRTSVYLENGTVEVVRVFTDANLKGTRVTVELPA